MNKRALVPWQLLCGFIAASVGAEAQEALPRVDPEAVDVEPAALEQVTRLLEEMVARRRLAGAVVGVARQGQVAYLEAVGVRDTRTRAPMTERTLFRIYSMTKAVTAAAVMILYEEDRFELSDPVAGYLPQFADVVVEEEDGSIRPPTRPVTVEHLLLHTAGLSHRSAREYREASVRSRSITLPEFIDNVVAVPLRADPGTEYRYSASPTVLGRLVEIWSGQPLDVFLEERIFDPLGMRDTGFWVEPEDHERLASVYALVDGGGLRPHTIEELPFTRRPALLEGAVGLVSTVPDFLRFSQMLLNGGRLGDVRILSQRTVEMMVRNGLPDEILRERRGGTGWGLGNVAVVVDPAGAEEGARIGEYRWDGSAGTEFWVDPTTETVVVTMWQSAPANPDRLRQRIRAVVREGIR